MEFGVFLPISGRAAGGDTLIQTARQAEDLGYAAVWAADRIIIPWEIRTPYEYSADRRFIVPPDRPFLEPLTVLAFLAAATERIKLGMSVLVLPYRPPVYSAKIVTSIDHLSRGRMILGVGTGWMVEEFEALNASFPDRARIWEEQVDILRTLWREERPSFRGRFYHFENIAFYPKPYQRPTIPIWVGGEGKRAQRRAALYGDSWFPYFVKIAPAELRARFDNVRRLAKEAGRDPDQISFNCCLPIELRKGPEPQEEGRLIGNPDQLVTALKGYQGVGVEHMSLQFMVPRWPERIEQIEAFAREVMPALR